MKRHAVILGLAALLCGCTVYHAPEPLSVMVAEGAHYAIGGENPMTVMPGESISFPIAVEDGYILTPPVGAVWDGETLTVSRMLYPMTLYPVVREKPEDYSLRILDLWQAGEITSTHRTSESYPEGTTITVRVKPQEGMVFIGWSEGRSIAHGGQLLSEEVEYTFSLSRDTVLYPNYLSEEEAAARATVQVVYNANGGIAPDGGTAYVQNVELGLAKLPNLLPYGDTFRRDGYILIEYNTKADGTGTGYSLGSKLDVDPAATVLFCIWAKESDASLFVSTSAGGKRTITAYRGDEDRVVIPETIGGEPVVGIAQGAFQKKNFETLVLPESIRRVEPRAFVDCMRFTTLYMFDTVEAIYDNSFTYMAKMAHFYLNAAMPTKYAGSTEGNFYVKWERLVTTQDENRVVILSGSSSLYGLKSPQMEELLGGAYTVVNYGTNAGTSSTLYMEVCAHYMHEGDILIQAPCPQNANQLGLNEITWRLFRGTECYYNVFRLVDMRRYTKLFSSLTEFNEGRRNMADSYYGKADNDMDAYGDMKKDFPLSDPTYGGSKNSAIRADRINDAMSRNLARAHKDLTDAGVKVYFSYGVSCRNQFRDSALTEAYLSSVEEADAKKLTIPVISRLGEYIFEGQYLYNSTAHLGAEGRRIRTERLARDLIAQLQKEGITLSRGDE